jgi:hypothetical protein
LRARGAGKLFELGKILGLDRGTAAVSAVAPSSTASRTARAGTTVEIACL